MSKTLRLGSTLVLAFAFLIATLVFTQNAFAFNEGTTGNNGWNNGGQGGRDDYIGYIEQGNRDDIYDLGTYKTAKAPNGRVLSRNTSYMLYSKLQKVKAQEDVQYIGDWLGESSDHVWSHFALWHPNNYATYTPNESENFIRDKFIAPGLLNNSNYLYKDIEINVVDHKYCFVSKSKGAITAWYIDDAKLYEPVKETSTVTSTIYQKSGDDVNVDLKKYWNDHSSTEQSSLKKIYDSASNSYPYEHTTPMGSYNDNFTITNMTCKVTKTTTYERNAATGQVRNKKTTYTRASQASTETKTISYSVANPTIDQVRYKPILLNSSYDSTVYASSVLYGLSNKDISGTEPIKAQASNIKKAQNEEDISTLDINADSQFTLSFDDGSAFGLPGDFSWTEKPVSIKTGDYVADLSSEYCNGVVSSNSDGFYRYSLAFNASMSSSTSAYETSSVAYDGKEATSSDVLKFEYEDYAPYNLPSSEWSTRFSMTGRYETDNPTTSYSQWWNDTYIMAKEYEYGVSYKGVVKPSGIGAPTVISEKLPSGALPSPSATTSGWSIVTNADEHQRGLYVSAYQVDCVQPVIHGIWNVETLAVSYQ